MMDYETVKRMAKGRGLRVKDLLALAEKNDPFYVGQPAQILAAEWFADLWQRFGYTTGVHLRRVHYQAASSKIPILKPNGKPYENTQRSWDYLCEAGQWARYLGLVDPGAFVDRRNPEAIINTHWKKSGDWNYEDPTPDYAVLEGEGWIHNLPYLPGLQRLGEDMPGLPAFEVSGYIESYGGDAILQPYHVEVWCEKTTMNDVLGSLCRLYDANLITGAGEMSITSVVDFMGRVRHAERPARILYISDYDPAGLGMPISVARKIEFFQRHDEADGLDIRLQPVILTAEQVAAYELPRIPVKESDGRKANWEADHGEGQVELDALEALHPGELANIVEAAILEYHDPDLVSKALRMKRDLEQALREERSEVLENYQDDLDNIEADYEALRADFNKLRYEFTELVKPFQERIDAYKESLDDIGERWDNIQHAITDDLRAVDVDPDDYPLPEPDLPEESDGTLYVSERDYLEQLEYYQAYREGKDQP